MSISQMKQYLGAGPRAPPADSTIHVFYYGGHMDYEEFIEKMPGSICAGIGCILGWNYHINQLGQPNIRRNFMGVSDNLYDTTVVVASPRTVVSDWTIENNQYCLGWVMQCKGSDYSLLDQIYGKDKVRTLLTVRTSISNDPPRQADLSCVAYWDPRNTQDLGRSIRTSKEEHVAWSRGFQRLDVTLCPKWYIAKLDWITHGKSPYVEPLLVDPSVTQTKIVREKFGEEAFNRAREQIKARHLQAQQRRVAQVAKASGVRAYLVAADRVRLVIKGVRKDRDGTWKRAEEVLPSTLSKKNFDPPPQSTTTKPTTHQEKSITVRAAENTGTPNGKHVKKRGAEEEKVAEKKTITTVAARRKSGGVVEVTQKKMGRPLKVRKTQKDSDEDYMGA